MDNRSVIADGFAVILTSFRTEAELRVASAEREAVETKRLAAMAITEAEAKAAEAKKLMGIVHHRALESFDIGGRLNALGAERIVPIGKPDEYQSGVLMFVIDAQNHGTLLTFGSEYNPAGFYRLCWCCVDERLILEGALGAVRDLRSWDLGTNDSAIRHVMTDVRKATEARAWELNNSVVRLQRLAPALEIEIRPSPPLRIASLTPREWWNKRCVSHLRADD